MKQTEPWTLTKAWVLAGEARRGHLVMLVVLALAATGLEFVGASLMLVVLALVANSGQGITLPLLGDVSDHLPGATEGESILWAAVALGVFFVVRGAAVLGQTYVQLRVLHKAGARLATALLRGYVRTPYVLHLRRQSAEVVRNLDQAVRALVMSVLMPVITLVTQSMMVAALLVFLLLTAWQVTVLALVVIVPTIALLLRFVQPRLKVLGAVTAYETARCIQLAQQTMAGMREVRLHRREGFFVEAFAASAGRTAQAEYTKGAAVHLPRLIFETILVLAMLMLVVITAVGSNGETATVSVVGLFAYVSFRLQPALQQIVSALNNLRYASAIVDHLYTDYTTMDHAPIREARPAVSSAPPLRHLQLSSVSFTYGEEGRYALRDVDLEVFQGESIGICGPTGSGKSTLVDVVCGLLTPSTGSVRCNGKDIANDLAGWYSRIGFVSQSVYLFEGTIRSNIAFGLPAQEIDDERVEEAARLAQLDSMLRNMPDGLESEVGERGVRVSGGQRQRIAIARALYLRPELLIFDEGTSALDNTTEASLIRAIDELRGDRTIITVAHRLSTVRRCDRIVYLDHGSVEAEGSYDQLLARHAGFTAMVANQG